MQKPSIPKGTRDFTPQEMVRRNYIFDTIRDVFQLFGYLPIETPAMENLSSLMGKYGEEGDKLLFRILNSGDFLSGLEPKDIEQSNLIRIAAAISEKGLRYDLTVPFARFVVQHRNEIAFPFKRYQIQPVWRADKPQRGRYREFYQCDVDVIGSTSLLNEVELILIIDEVFHRLGLDVLVRLNNRKILTGIAEYVGQADKMMTITIALDKLDKIGVEGVNEEMRSRGIPGEAIEKLQPVLRLEGKLKERFPRLQELLQDSPTGMQGIEEAMYVLRYLKDLELRAKFDLDLTLARGLDYYTGSIIEVTSREVAMGSICGGGRYDDLTGIFGLPGVSGVGVSFGADRIYDVLNELNRFPGDQQATTQIMFVNFGPAEEKYCMGILKEIRKSGINAEIYPEAAKMKKQMAYADQKNIPYVILVGETEMKSGKVSLKNMVEGSQQEISIKELLSSFVKK
ncbi:MAG: histidine--tRNA ligase [Bacteroidetes bacterium]|nr:histidine--tRNA ligase [Bacteroidota bacterium]